MLFPFYLFYINCATYSVTNNVLTISGTGTIDQKGVRSKGDYLEITEVNIEEGPESILEKAFESCSKLQKISISSTISSIIAPFYRCPKLQTINVSLDNKYYYSENDILYSKGTEKALVRAPTKEIEIPEGVKIIKTYSFSTDKEYNYIRLIIPNSVTVIESYAFALVRIETFAFKENPSLSQFNGFYWGEITNLMIPNSCTEILENCFHNTLAPNIIFQKESKLITINKNAFSYSRISSIEFPESLQTVQSNAFLQSLFLESIYFGSKVYNISMNAFDGCSKLRNLTISEENPYYTTIEGMIMTKDETEILYIADNETINIKEKVSKISKTILQSMKSLKNLEIDKNNEYYAQEDGVLYNKNFTKLIAICGGITQVTANSKVTELSEYCAYGCSSLKNFTFPRDTICNYIQTYAFSKSGLLSFTVPDSLLKIYYSAFSECSDLKEFIIPESSQLNEIQSMALYASSIESVYIPEQITEITRQLFDQCSKLEIITFAQNSNCSTLATGCFGFTALKSIIIPKDVKEIQSTTFQNCKELESVQFEDESKLEKILDNAFLNCENLTEINIPDSCLSIGLNAFKNCKSLCNVTNNAENISTMAFADCVSLTKFKFSSKIKTIDSDTFKGCISLTSFEVELGNSNIMTKDGVVFDIDESTLILFPPGVEEAVITKSTKAFGERSFANSVILKRVLFLNGNEMKTFSSYTFSGCSSLTDVQFPTQLETISSNCFYMCTSLTSISLPSSLTDIDSSAFSGCSSLETIQYCGTNSINTKDAFDQTNNNIVVYVLSDYSYNTFCTLKVQKIMSSKCELIPAACEKITCKVSKPKHINALIIAPFLCLSF